MRSHRAGWRALTLWEGRGHRQLPFFAMPSRTQSVPHWSMDYERHATGSITLEEHWRAKPLARDTRSELSVSKRLLA